MSAWMERVTRDIKAVTRLITTEDDRINRVVSRLAHLLENDVKNKDRTGDCTNRWRNLIIK